MITGFNPADMYGVDHIRRVLTTFPGVFTGIGEFSIHKEFVSAKIAGETASLTNPALDRILDFAAEAGLVVILHNDIDMPFAKEDTEPVVPGADEGACSSGIRRRRSSGRTSASAASCTRCASSAEAAERHPTQVAMVEAMRRPIRRSSHVNFDISWDEVAKYAVASPESIARVARDAEHAPGPVPVRHRHGGAGRPGAVLRGVRHVGAGLAPADAGGEPQGAQGQLRADLRRRTAQGPRMGEGERAMTAFTEKETWTCELAQTNRSAGVGLASDDVDPAGSAAMASAHAPESRGRRPAAVKRAGHSRSKAELSRFTALRCSTSATTSNRSTRTGSTPCASPGCRKFENEFGEDDSTFAGVRQSRLGFRSSTPTDLGEFKTIFEFELFGTGADEGQTTFRLRHAWGELGAIGAGQYLEPLQRSGRVPEHAGVLGSHGYSVVPQRAAPLHGDPQRHQQPDVRSRAPGRKRRPGGLCRPYRA